MTDKEAITKNDTILLSPSTPVAASVTESLPSGLEELLVRVIAGQEQLLQKQSTAIDVLLRMMTNFEKERHASPWVNAREAASLLGFDISKKNYPRKLSWLIRNGWIQKYQDGRPRRYYREELVKVGMKIASGEIAFVGQV